MGRDSVQSGGIGSGQMVWRLGQKVFAGFNFLHSADFGQ